MTNDGLARTDTGSMPPTPPHDPGHLDDPGHGVGRITPAQFAAIQDYNLGARRNVLRGAPWRVLSVALLALLTMSAAGVTGYWNGYDVSGRQADEAFQRLDQPDHDDEERAQMAYAIFQRVSEYLGKLRDVGGQPGDAGERALGYITSAGATAIELLKEGRDEPNPRPAKRAAGLKGLAKRLE